MHNTLLKRMEDAWESAVNVNSYYAHHGTIPAHMAVELLEVNARAELIADLLAAHWILEDHEMRDLEEIRLHVDHARMVASCN